MTIQYSLYGRKISEAYDWIFDPKQYKKDGHIPHNRCYHCGTRFLFSKFAAFCNICDNEMSPPHDEKMFVVTRYDAQAKPPIREGYWTTRAAMVKNRIRIPDDADEKEYEKKVSDFIKAEEDKALYKPDWKFQTGMDVAREQENV